MFLPHPMLTRTQDQVVRLADEMARRVTQLVLRGTAGGGPVTFDP